MKQLIDAFHFMVDEHIKDCEAQNITPERGYKGSFNVRLTPELHKIDSVVSNLRPEMDLMCGSIYGNLKEIYKVFSCVKPIDDDDVRQMWIEIERGSLEAFGDYDEYKQYGEVETQEDFEQLWRAYYPEKTKWYQFQTAKYRDDLYFYFDGKLIFSIDLKTENSDSKPGWNLEYIQQFTDWLLERINDETEKLGKNIASYMRKPSVRILVWDRN